jgi:hypothetical protein
MNTSPRYITISGLPGALYAEGNSPIGELGLALRMASSTPWDDTALQETITRDIQRELNTCQTEISHLKITASRDAAAPAPRGRLLLTLQAAATPEVLAQAVERALAAAARAFPHLSLVLDTPDHP